jgi:hypothetical protein
VATEAIRAWAWGERVSPHPPTRQANIVGKTASAGDKTNLGQCRPRFNGTFD